MRFAPLALAGSFVSDQSREFGALDVGKGLLAGIATPEYFRRLVLRCRESTRHVLDAVDERRPKAIGRPCDLEIG